MANHRSIGQRLAANGVGDAEIRLGWEATNSSFVWTAVNRPAELWKACFTNAAKALKSGSQALRISWHMAKKGKMNALTIWPADAPITNIGISHYDDAEARYGMELTPAGSPWGLPGWRLPGARARGWSSPSGGVGRVGDNPAYIRRCTTFSARRGRRWHMKAT